jgi:intein/homing endonuclease
MAHGMDCGTYTLVCCKRDDKGNFVYNHEINAFLEISLEHRYIFNMMKSTGVPLIERENVAYALGEAAVKMAYSMPDLELRRPMKDGCVNPSEKDAFEIMNTMIHSLMENTKKDKEILYYSVPSNAINEQTDADYHTKLLQSIFDAYESDEGYKVVANPINEGLALVYAELEKKAYTGIGVSCLCPGTKIYTQSGLKNIEDVKPGDEVFTHKGRWRTVYDTVQTYYKGPAKSIKIVGDNSESRFVDDHKLYVCRNGMWDWLGCDSLKVGDIVGEKVEIGDNKPRLTIEVQSRVTCSKLWKIETYELSPDLCRLIGYFLGDGSVNLSEGCFQFDFANYETENIKDIEKLVKSIFNKNVARTKHGENCTRLKCYSKHLAKWFKNNCYVDKQKRCPIEVGTLTDDETRNLLIGLINSDGRISEDSVCFYNSNSHLIHLAKRLFARLGVAASIYAKIPKTSIIKTRVITSKKTAYVVFAGSQTAYDALQLVRENRTSNRLKNQVVNGYSIAKVKAINEEYYEGWVYDLKVAEDHSFSAPGMLVKNCGAGMINLCFAIYGSPVFQFALVNSGDWIDRQAAKAAQESIAYINHEKTKVDLGKAPTSLVERAIQTQYRIMIEKTLSGIKKGIEKTGKKARTEENIDIVVAGGTSMAKGFIVLFKEVLANAKLPIKIGNVIHPAEPLFSVAKGCCVAAENAAK